ncbi:MAG: hypothetical protein Q4F61_03730, partial [Candidatus Saccharibacteria bacterium]|nr:hypothetical protein [Candidatus Saccharibacteria bacterium]
GCIRLNLHAGYDAECSNDFLSVSSEYFDEPKKFLRILENCLLRTLKRAVRQEQFSLRNPKKLPGAKSTVHERWIKNPINLCLFGN